MVVQGKYNANFDAGLEQCKFRAPAVYLFSTCRCCHCVLGVGGGGALGNPPPLNVSNVIINNHINGFGLVIHTCSIAKVLVVYLL